MRLVGITTRKDPIFHGESYDEIRELLKKHGAKKAVQIMNMIEKLEDLAWKLAYQLDDYNYESPWYAAHKRSGCDCGDETLDASLESAGWKAGSIELQQGLDDIDRMRSWLMADGFIDEEGT